MRAALYARFSTDNQNVASVDRQLIGCQGYAAERLGAHVVREFSDEGISGQAMGNRPGVLALLEFCRVGGCDVVIAEHTNRLSRSGSGGWQVFEELQDLGIRYFTVMEGEVTTLSQGFSSLKSAMDIDEIKARTRGGLARVVASGRSAGGCPYGYRMPLVYDARGERVRGLREIDPERALVVERIFTDYAAGLSPLAIATALNAEGVPGPRGGPWGQSTLQGDQKLRRGVLLNELYRGVRVWGRNSTLKDRRTGQRRALAGAPAGAVQRALVPELRIVPEPLWVAVEARRAAQAIGPAGEGKGQRRPKTLLQGLIRCANCNGAMTRGGTGDHLRCATRAGKGAGVCHNMRTPRYGDIERRVLVSLHANLLHPDMVAEAVAEFQKTQAEEHRQAARAEGQVRRELDDVTRRAGRLLDQVEREAMPWPLVADRHAALKARAGGLQAQLEAVAKGAEVVTLHPSAAGLYRRMIEDLGQLLADPGRDGAEAREALRGLVQAVLFKPLPVRGAYDLEILAELAPLLGDGQSGDRLVRAANSRSRFTPSHQSPTTVRLAG